MKRYLSSQKARTSFSTFRQVDRPTELGKARAPVIREAASAEAYLLSPEATNCAPRAAEPLENLSAT